jgi:FAD binding domain
VDRCRRGRVFLVGDAAHLNPPFGGHGLNTGIGDAVDLGWKLAAALAGWGGPALLDSYEAERRPLHRRVIDEATANMATLAPELLDDDLDRPGPDGDRARSAAASRIEQTKRAEYFSTDLVLGHRYQDSPVLQAVPPATAVRAGGSVPGGRLPHHWVSAQVSTLDLITGPHAILTADGELGARAGRAASAAGLPVTVTVLTPPVMGELGAELIVVRPDQVVAAVWPPSGPDRLAETEFLDTTMAMLGGRQGAETTWTRSH